MADRYVSSLAAGGGAGTSGSPWTIYEAASSAANGDVVNVKADGTYTLGVADLVFSQSSLWVRGYTSTINDGGRASLTSSVSTGFTIKITGTGSCLQDLIIDDANTSFGSADCGAQCSMYRCKINGGYWSQSSVMIDCEIHGGTLNLRGGSVAYGCSFTAGAGGSAGSNGVFVRCKAVGASNYNFSGGIVIECTSDSPAFHGAVGSIVIDSLISNAGYPFSGSVLWGVRGYNNGGGGTAPVIVTDFSVLSADPYTNTAGDDYSLNNNAGGGADCRGASVLTSLPTGSTHNYSDIGASQHQDSGGGGGGTTVLVID